MRIVRRVPVKLVVLVAMMLPSAAIAGGGMYGLYQPSKGNMALINPDGAPVTLQASGTATMSKKKMLGIGAENRLNTDRDEYLWSAKFRNASDRAIAAYEICFDGINGFGEIQATECFSKSKQVEPGKKGKISDERDFPEGDIQTFNVRVSRVRFSDGST